MIIHPNFDPVAISLGPISIHWYGVMYLLGFAGVYVLGNYRAQRLSYLVKQNWRSEMVGDLIFYGALGAIIGGRLGYVAFYKPLYYLQNPLEIAFINQGGMSFHGGLIGVAVAIYLFARKHQRPFLQITDFIAPLAPIGLFFGRMGNFINQELWGKETSVPWGMVFSNGGPNPRHPSMLYEAALEGLVLFIVLLIVSRRERAPGQLSGLFLCGYAISRIVVEFVRVPDEHLRYLAFNWLTMGQLLSVPMLVLGLYFVLRTGSRK